MASEFVIGGDGALFIGEDKTLEMEVLDVDGVPVNIATWAGKFYVAKRDADIPDAALIDKTPSVIGIYNATRASNTQRWRVTIAKADWSAVETFRGDKTYRHAWARTDTGQATVTGYGDFTPQKAPGVQ